MQINQLRVTDNEKVLKEQMSRSYFLIQLKRQHVQDLQTKCKLTRDFLFLVDSETHRKKTPLQHFSTPVKPFKTVQ